MKRLLTFVFLISFLTACETTDCECVPPPIGSELNGEWEFIRVHYGFTNITQTAAEAGFSERLKIDATYSQMIRFRNSMEVEKTMFSISKQNERNIITFEDSKEYSYYTLTTEGGKALLSLYQRAPVGAILADGGTFYYEKK